MLEPPLTPPASPLEQERGAFVFFSYAHRDKGFRDRLQEHLSNLKYRGLITTWYDGEISAGEEWAQQIDSYLNKAHIILLLISASFMASEYCYSIEMLRALERHERQEVDVIPILLRPVLFTDAPFAKLQMLPTNGKPIVQWRDRDSAFVDIAYAIERVAQKYLQSAQIIPGLPTEHAPYVGELAMPSGTQAQSLGPPTVAVPSSQPPAQARGRRPSLLLLGVVGLVVCVLISSSFLFFLAHSPASTCPPGVECNTDGASGSNIFLGLLVLVSVITTLIAIGAMAIRAKIRQRRAQRAFEEARKRGYYEEAIEAYRRALSSNPLDADALRGMGNALYALGHYDQALDAFTRAIECDSTAAAYAGLGDVFARLKRYSEAVAAYEKAIELDPTVTLNYGDLMQALLALGRKEEAERVHARARQLGNEDQE